MTDKHAGISLRFIRAYDAKQETCTHPHLIAVTVSPQIVCRDCWRRFPLDDLTYFDRRLGIPASTDAREQGDTECTE